MMLATSARSIGRAVPHAVAMALAMIYAWHVSQSAYVTTGIQFLSPLLIIVLCHLAFLALQRRLNTGYAGVVLRNSMWTTVLLIGVILATDTLGPSPSHAAGDTMTAIMGFLFCLVVLAIVLAVAAGALYLLFLILVALKRWITGGGKDDGVNDLGGIILAVVLIAGSSLEGVPGAYKFAGDGHSTASYRITAPPDAVWAAMQTATSPQFPLPDILQMFPRPVAVPVDEGTTLGSNRVVQFVGREGRGKLHLRVTRQSDRRAEFTVISHTGPMANWIGIKSLTYTIDPDPEGARLSVRLDYERLLAPSWIFTPMVENAVYLAMSVLAKDTKQRAEQRADT